MFRRKVGCEEFICEQFKRRCESFEIQNLIQLAANEGMTHDDVLVQLVESQWQMILMEAAAKYPKELGQLGQAQHSTELKLRAIETALPVIYYSYVLVGQSDQILNSVRQRMTA